MWIHTAHCKLVLEHNQKLDRADVCLDGCSRQVVWVERGMYVGSERLCTWASCNVTLGLGCVFCVVDCVCTAVVVYGQL